MLTEGLTIMLVDDHPVVREGYRRLLERQPGYRVVAEAEDAATAYRAYRETTPGVVVMDLSMPGAGGLEAVRHIRLWDRDARILIFSMHQTATFAFKALEAGAVGYITKSSSPNELVRAIQTVARGGRALSEDIAQEIAADRLSDHERALQKLAPRETEILRMFASGMGSQEIADTLCLSLKTIQNYQSQIRSKLDVRSDPDLVWLAIRSGLVLRS